MALNGSLEAVSSWRSDAQTYRSYIFSWTATQSASNNTSTISWSVKSGGTYQWGVALYKLYIKINGSSVYSAEYTSSTRPMVSVNTTITSGTTTITHAANGTASFSVSIECAVYYSSVNGSNSTTFTLNTIARTCTISYNANGGSSAPGSHTGTIGTATKLSSSVPTRAGYQFLGWSTSSTATAASYGSGASYTPTGTAVTFYAVWKALSYTVTLNRNDGTSTTSSVSVTYNSTTGNSVTVPTRKGYTFLGYYTAASGGKQVYSNTGACVNGTGYWSSSKWAYAGNVTLYAQWRANTYTVAYQYNGGSGTTSNQTHTYGSTLALTKCGYTRKGYEFLGWSLDSNATEPTYEDEEVVSNLSSTQGDTVYLYAVWKLVGLVFVKIDGTYKRGLPYIRSDGTYKLGSLSIRVDQEYQQ